MGIPRLIVVARRGAERCHDTVKVVLVLQPARARRRVACVGIAAPGSIVGMPEASGFDKLRAALCGAGVWRFRSAWHCAIIWGTRGMAGGYRIGSRKVGSHARHDDRDPCFHVRERSCFVAGPEQDPAGTEAVPVSAHKRHGDTTSACRSPAADAKRPAARRAQGRRFRRTEARPVGANSKHLQELLTASCRHQRACPGDLVQEGKAVPYCAVSSRRMTAATAPMTTGMARHQKPVSQ